MTELIILIIRTALEIISAQAGGQPVLSNADAILDIISKAKAAYEKETGQPIDVEKIKPYIPIE